MKENKFSEKDITGELGEVIIGKAPGRERKMRSHCLNQLAVEFLT